jgi:GntR family transcriptional regulator
MIDFHLDKQSPVPFYRQIVDLVLAGVSGGQIAPGEQLPTIRDMAVRLEINPNTVSRAYMELQHLDVLDTQQGSGVFVKQAKKRTLDRKQRARMRETLCRDFVGRAQQFGIDLDELVSELKKMKSNGK